MYEHPYLSHQLTRFDQEEIVRAAERRRLLREHADQIVPRPPGVFRRMLRRIAGGRTDAARPASSLGAARDRAANTRAVNGGVGVGCGSATAPAR